MGNEMIAQTKTNCFWFDLGPTLLSGWVSDQTTAGAETVQMEERERENQPLEQAIILLTVPPPSLSVCEFVDYGGPVGWRSGLRPQSLLGETRRYLWDAWGGWGSEILS